MLVTKSRMSAFSTVGLEKHAKDPVHLAGRDAAVDSEEGNFVMKCRRAAVYSGMVDRSDYVSVLNGKASPRTSETDRVRVQEGKLRELNGDFRDQNCTKRRYIEELAESIRLKKENQQLEVEAQQLRAQFRELFGHEEEVLTEPGKTPQLEMNMIAKRGVALSRAVVLDGKVGSMNLGGNREMYGNRRSKFN